MLPQQGNGADWGWHNSRASTAKRLLKDHEETKQCLLTQLEGSKQNKGCPENMGVRFLAGQKKKGKIFMGIVCAKVFRHNANCKKSTHSDQQGFQRMELST